MYKYMMAHPNFLTKDNAAGVRRVYEGVHDYGKLVRLNVGLLRTSTLG